MDLNEVLNESLDGMWRNKPYGGNSEPPRKDYMPYTTKDGYAYPFQQGGSAAMPPSPDPDNTPDLPWPLQGITEDLSDSFVYLATAYQKMERCVKENPAPSDRQKEKIKKLMKFVEEALIRIKEVGVRIVPTSDLASKFPAQNPIQGKK